jgi:hypothetical protein
MEGIYMEILDLDGDDEVLHSLALLFECKLPICRNNGN